MLTFDLSVFIRFTFFICSVTFFNGLSFSCPCVDLSSVFVLFLFLVPINNRLSRVTIDISHYSRLSLVYAHLTSVYIIPMYHHVIVTVITTTFTNSCLIKGV